MKKSIVALGITATVLAGAVAPTASFAAQESSNVVKSDYVAPKKWVTEIRGKDYWYNEYNVPKTYFYVQGTWAGELNLIAYEYNAEKKTWRGIYEGWIYRKE